MLRTFLRRAALLPIGIASISPCIACGAIGTYTAESTFLSAAGSTSLESFEGLPDNSPATVVLTTSYFTMTPLGVAHVSVRSSGTGGHFPTDGTKYVEFSPNGQSSSTLRWDFNTPVRSFGLSISDWGDSMFGGTLSVQTNAGESTSPIQIAVNPPQRASGTLMFFGFVQDTPFTQILLNNTTANDGWGIDEVYFTVVPEPGAHLVGLVCIMLVGAQRMRRWTGSNLGPLCEINV